MLFNLSSTQVICTVFVLPLVIYIGHSHFKEGGSRFLNREENFDSKYFEIRAKTNYEKNCLATFPFDNVRERFCDGYIFDNYSFDEYIRKSKELSDYTFRSAAPEQDQIFFSLIDGLFDELKDPNSSIYKKVFEERPFKVDFWDGKRDHNLIDVVRSILSHVPNKNAVTLNELDQIDKLFYQIAINGIMKNESRLNKLRLYLSKVGFINPKDTILREYIHIYDLDHLLLIFEGLSEELNIQLTIYDVSHDGPESSFPRFTFSPADSYKEIKLIAEFPLTKHTIQKLKSKKPDRKCTHNLPVQVFYNKNSKFTLRPSPLLENNYDHLSKCHSKDNPNERCHCYENPLRYNPEYYLVKEKVRISRLVAINY